MHPLAVDPHISAAASAAFSFQRLRQRARSEDVETIWLGSDDDFGGTSLHGIDLYPDVLRHLSRLSATEGHPFTFYRKHGYTVVGMLPDVNGFGKPDILMAKRISAR